MNDPQRLQDQYAGRLEGALIESVAADRPSRRARRRVLAAVAAASSATMLPATTTAALAAKGAGVVGTAALVKSAAVGVLLGVLSIGAVEKIPRWFVDSPPRVTEPSRVVAVAKANASTLEPSSASAVPSESVPPEPTVPAPGSVQPSRAIPRAEAPRVITEPSRALADVRPEMRLAEQTALLDRARRIVSREPWQALQLLDDYAKNYPQSDLAPEADALRVEALVGANQRGAAEALAREILARTPASTHAERIRVLLGWAEEPR